jgi:hypothetical protein
VTKIRVWIVSKTFCLICVLSCWLIFVSRTSVFFRPNVELCVCTSCAQVSVFVQGQRFDTCNRNTDWRGGKSNFSKVKCSITLHDLSSEVNIVLFMLLYIAIIIFGVVLCLDNFVKNC